MLDCANSAVLLAVVILHVLRDSQKDVIQSS